MKIISIIGARPQFIKVPLLSKELRKKNHEIIIHTGQHYDYELSKLFFDELQIPKPDYNLEVGSGSHGYQTGEMIKGIEEVLLREKPHLVLVYGDTNSTAAGALAAAKLHIPIAHVEAGMRNFDRKKPEEINRILTDHISDVLFAPTQTAIDNLSREGIHNGVYLVGDLGYDVLKVNQKIADKKSRTLEEYNLELKNYLVVTIHKDRNTDNRHRLQNIVSALTKAKEKIIFPMHPRTRKYLEKFGLLDSVIEAGIIVTGPLGYLNFLKLLSNSKKIVTDSGGVQKEAYVFKVPCITLRKTEWVETVEEGWNIEVEVYEESIVDAIQNFNPAKKQINFLGDGMAFKKIAGIIAEF